MARNTFMKNPPKVRTGKYQPRVERLESRTQPGSLLFASPGAALLDSTLDGGSLPLPTSPAESLSLVHRANDHDSGMTVQTVPGAPATAPPKGTPLVPTTPTPSPTTGLPTAPPVPASVTPAAFAAPLTGTAAPSGGQHTGPLSNQTVSPLAVTSLPQAVPVAPPVVTAAPALAPIPAQLVRVQTSSGGIGAQVTESWGTYLNGNPFRGQSTATHVKYTTSGLFIVGSQIDPYVAGQEDLAIIKLSLDGSTATVALVSLGTGTKAWGRNIDVSPNGSNVYVDGFVGANPENRRGGPSSDFIVSLPSNFSGINWAVGHTAATRAAEYGLKLDATGTYLYCAGDIDLSSAGGPAHNLEVCKLLALNDTSVYDFVYTFSDASGNPTPTVDARVAGIAGIATDSMGRADVVANIDTEDANGYFAVEPLFGQLAPDGASFNAAFRYLSVGRGGIGSDITVSSTDNYYFTGSYSGDGITQGLLIADWTSSNMPMWGWVWTFGSSRGNLDTFGSGLRVGSDGSVYTSATLRDPFALPSTSASLEIDHFSSDGNLFIDGTLGSIGDRNNDIAAALDNGLANNTYAVGATTSLGFPVTPGAYQTAFEGPLDGYALSLHLT
jgi:hypothetical protein